MFVVTLDPLNNSGVTGQGTIIRKGSKITVNLDISGVEPELMHLMHIHGFGDPMLDQEFGLPTGDKASQCPPASASATPSADAIPGLISDHQSELFSGAEMKDLAIKDETRIFPRGDASGRIRYRETLKAETDNGVDLGDLALRGVEVHGAYVAIGANGDRVIVHSTTPGVAPLNSVYIDNLPIACGKLQAVSNGPDLQSRRS